MSLSDKLDLIKAFLTDRVEDRTLTVHGDDTDALFDMLDGAIEDAGSLVTIPLLTDVANAGEVRR